MTNEELLRELESLVEAMEQTLAIISGTVAELRGPDLVLKHMLAAKGATESYHGPNQWRDRLVRDTLRIVALKARPLAADDPELQSLIASVLQAPVANSQKN